MFVAGGVSMLFLPFTALGPGIQPPADDMTGNRHHQGKIKGNRHLGVPFAAGRLQLQLKFFFQSAGTGDFSPARNFEFFTALRLGQGDPGTHIGRRLPCHAIRLDSFFIILVGSGEQSPDGGISRILHHLAGKPDVGDLHGSEDHDQNHRNTYRRFHQHAAIIPVFLQVIPPTHFIPRTIHRPAAIAIPKGTLVRSESFGGSAAFPALRSYRQSNKVLA